MFVFCFLFYIGNNNKKKILNPIRYRKITIPLFLIKMSAKQTNRTILNNNNNNRKRFPLERDRKQKVIALCEPPTFELYP